MQLTPDFLRNYVEMNPNLVQRKESKRFPGLYTLKYKRRVFYDALWDDVLMECRGLVVDADYNIVIHPFTKVFNRGERDTDINRDEMCVVTKKINGFMAALTYVEGYGPVVSTTGSLDSEHADMAAEWLEPLYPVIEHRFKNQNQKETFIFEICDERDPHIIQEKPGPYLIGHRDYHSVSPKGTGFMAPETDLDYFADLFNHFLQTYHVRRPEFGFSKFSDVVKNVQSVEHEGYMVLGIDSKTKLKIKSPYYKTLKMLARSGDVDKLVGPQAKQRFEEEFYPLIDHIAENSEKFSALDEQNRLQYVIDFLQERQDYTQEVLEKAEEKSPIILLA